MNAPRILTTHTGSLPRPPALTRLYAEQERGAVDEAVLAKARREAVRWIIDRQVECGIDIGNDGEQQREHFFLYMRRRLSGLGGAWHRPQRRDIGKYPLFQKQREAELAARTTVRTAQSAPPKAIGPIRYLEPGVGEECELFQAALAERQAAFVATFMTAPSPGILATAMANEHYASDLDYLEALTAALRSEYERIVAAGLILQIDAPDLALERALSFQDRPLTEFLAFVERVIAAINRALSGLPREKVRMHVCWGNAEAPHDEDLPLEEIAPLLREARVGAFVLPFANPRHAHEFKLLPRLLSGSQSIVAGVIDTTTNYVEHPEVVADRLERITAVVGDPRRVQAGTDCGFDTGAGLGRVAPDVVWAKLASLAEGARLASSRLI